VLHRGAKEITHEFNKNQVKDENDKPIPLSTSPAAEWKAKWNRVPKPSPQVWYTGYVVMGSLGVFMLYFCILREENDLDDIIYRPLPEVIDGLEKQYPNYDFYAKPDYVVYYDKLKSKKQEEKEKQ